MLQKVLQQAIVDWALCYVDEFRMVHSTSESEVQREIKAAGTIYNYGGLKGNEFLGGRGLSPETGWTV
ncbi:hypothetical protein AOLI_G00048840 [Acnodon oligacanthus]